MNFLRLGILSGDTVLVRAGMLAVGEVEGGSRGFVRALVDTGGPEGRHRDDYLSLGDSEDAYRMFRDMKLACRKVGGTFLLLWHNTELVRQEQRELYASVLDG